MVQLIKKDLFLKRARHLYEGWNEGKYGLGDVDAFVVLLGNSTETNYNRTVTFFTWLFTYEFADSVAIFTKEGIYFLASNRKLESFADIKSDTSDGVVPPIKTVLRNKEDHDAANFQQLIDHVKEAGNKLGYFAKDKFEGDFASSWYKAVDASGLDKVDITAPFLHALSAKDEAEVELTKKSAQCAMNTWNFAKRQIVDFIAKEKRVKHGKFSADIEALVGSPKVQGSLAANKNIDTAFSPIVMSGGNYSFKWSTESDEKTNIHYGCIIGTYGLRYESYCSNLSRTLFVNPSDKICALYDTVLATELHLIEALKPGTKVCDAYESTIKFLKEKDAKLADKLNLKDLGFLTGVQFRENGMLINAKCEEIVKPNMVFVVYIGIAGIKNPDAKDDRGKEFAIALSDTVLISEEGPNEVLTAGAKSRIKSVSIRYAEEADEEEQVRTRGDENKENADQLARGKRSVVLNDQTRNKATNEDKRKEHQKTLSKQLNDAARQRLAQQSGGEDSKKQKKSNTSYKSYEKFPQDSEINKLNIYVDRKHDTIIMPLFGVPVPFHISMIKNCSQSVEGDHTYLRINFTHPGSQIGKDIAMFPHPLATYVKELTYRASNHKEHGEANSPSFNLTNAFRLIKEIQKRFRSEEAEEREKEGAVKQDKLILSQGKANPKLKDLFVRPNIIAKRISGSIEAHVNGFRYTSVRGDKIDVLYNNIKHAFFQPCDSEMIILIHFHLKNPVLWGKKKYKDIQFYTEVGEITTDLGKYHHMQDRDDMQSEQMEREMRRKLNQMFQNFCDKVVKQTNDLFDFDTPFNELGFFGVPHRSSCTLKPTSACLVNLTEWPTFIITLDEVELVHFERVQFSLKNFDMVFIFKDYSRKVQMVHQIPMTSLDNVKEWLNSCDLKYTEGIQTLNWPKIMKTITDDPEQFFETGGWGFLDPDSGDEADEDESESEDAYSPSEEESGEDESDEDESEGEVSDDDDDSDASLGSDESEGKDWSDLEEEAAKADKRKEQEDGDTHSRSRDKDRKRPHGSSGGHSRHGHGHGSSSGGHRHRHSSSSGKAPPHKKRK